MNRYRFVHLNVHSHYSIMDGCASIRELVDAAIKDRMPGIAITDNGNMFGIMEFVEYVNRINRVREEKAAMLLYLVTKNHSFSDGNKRIAATLFLWFLNNNHILYREDGSKRLADNTLVALTLMIAESKTEEKDVMVKVVVNLINQRNE